MTENIIKEVNNTPEEKEDEFVQGESNIKISGQENDWKEVGNSMQTPSESDSLGTAKDFVSAKVLMVPEYKDILKKDQYVVSELPSLGRLSDFPDLIQLRASVDAQLEASNFSHESVEDQLTIVFRELVRAHAQMRKLDHRLEARETEMTNLADRCEHDSRVVRMLRLSEAWRRDKEGVDLLNQELQAQLDNCQSDMESMQYTNKRLTNMLTIAKRELESSRNEESADKIKLKLMSTQSELRKLEHHYSELNEQLMAEKQKIKEQKTTIDNLSKFEEMIFLMESEVSRNRRKKIELEREIEHCKNQRHLMSTDLAERDISLKEMIAHSEELHRTLISLNKFITGINTTVAKSKKVLDRKNNELECQYILIKRLKREKEILGKELLNRTKEINGFKKQINKYNTEDSKRNQQLVIARKDARDNSAKNIELMNKIDSCENTLRTVEHLNDGFKIKVESMSINLERKNNAIHQHEGKNIRLLQVTDVLTRNVNELADLSFKLQRNNTEVTILNREQYQKINDLNKRIHDQKQAMTSSEMKIITLQKHIEQLANQINSMRKMIHGCEEKKRGLAVSVFNALELLHGQERKVSLAVAEVQSAVFAVAVQDGAVAGLRNVIQQQESRICSLNTQQNQLKERFDVTMKSLKHEREELNSSLAVVNALNREVEKEGIRANTMQAQRDIFGARLIQTRLEMSLQQEKIETQSKVIENGKRAYTQSCLDVQVLKKEITNLRHKLKILETVEVVNDNLKRDLIQVKKELILEQAKKTSSDHFVIPRVHAMRALETTNPSHYEVILKNQKLVRSLIQKSDEVVFLEQRIVSVQRDFMACRTLLAARRPADCVTAHTARADLRRRDNQLKALIAELNMSRDNLDLQIKDNKRLSRELAAAKHQNNSNNFKGKDEDNAQKKTGNRGQTRVARIKPNPNYRRGKCSVGGGFVFAQAKLEDSWSEPNKRHKQVESGGMEAVLVGRKSVKKNTATSYKTSNSSAVPSDSIAEQPRSTLVSAGRVLPPINATEDNSTAIKIPTNEDSDRNNSSFSTPKSDVSNECAHDPNASQANTPRASKRYQVSRKKSMIPVKGCKLKLPRLRGSDYSGSNENDK